MAGKLGATGTRGMKLARRTVTRYGVCFTGIADAASAIPAGRGRASQANRHDQQTSPNSYFSSFICGFCSST
jgi:hypothetical protein